MPVTVLKRKHTLKGRNIFPLLKKVRDFVDDAGLPLARLSTQQRTEDLDADDCKRAFREITGENADEFLQMAGKPRCERNFKVLLHWTIIHANQQGQPGQVPVAPETATSDSPVGVNDQEEEPSQKKRKTDDPDDDLLRRVKLLEQGQDSVESLKDKVRALSMQSTPNESLLLLALDDLARTARKRGHTDADTYEELARQATKHQNSINIASLALGVVGGKAVDLVVKVLNKCVKEKQIEGKIQGQQEQSETKKETVQQSPLFNAYPPFPMQPMWQGYGNSPYYQRSRGRNFRPKGNCYFCDMPGHTMRECQKMKMAKAQNK